MIKSDMFSSVKLALAKSGYTSLTAYEVKGRGKQSGIIETVDGKLIRADILPKTKIEMIVKDSEVDAVVEIITETARTNTIGDGKIFISAIEDAVRIRTGERGDNAI